MDDDKLTEMYGMVTRIDERTACLPKLEDRVTSLERSQSWIWGVGSAVTFLGGVAEFLFHHGRSK